MTCVPLSPMHVATLPTYYTDAFWLVHVRRVLRSVCRYHDLGTTVAMETIYLSKHRSATVTCLRRKGEWLIRSGTDTAIWHALGPFAGIRVIPDCGPITGSNWSPGSGARVRSGSSTPYELDYQNRSQLRYIRKGRFLSTRRSRLRLVVRNRAAGACPVPPRRALIGNALPTTSEDLLVTYNNIRRAAEVHRQVRGLARKFRRPGVKLLEIAEEIEMIARALVKESGLESGIGFPIGLNINDWVAHYSQSPGKLLVNHV